MSQDMLLLFMIAFGLFAMQAIGGAFQIKNYKQAISRVHKKGNVGVGQKKGHLFNGNIVIIACDSEHIITGGEIMDGKTFLAKFHPVTEVLGKPLIGVSIEEVLQRYRSLDEKKQKTYRGYIQALEALEMRFANALEAEMERTMDTAEHPPLTQAKGYKEEVTYGLYI